MDGRTGGGRKKRKDIKNGTQQAFHQCKNRQRQRFISNALCSFSGHRNGLDGIIPYNLHQMQWRKRSSYRLQSNNPRSQWLRDKTATSIQKKKILEKVDGKYYLHTQPEKENGPINMLWTIQHSAPPSQPSTFQANKRDNASRWVYTLDQVAGQLDRCLVHA